MLSFDRVAQHDLTCGCFTGNKQPFQKVSLWNFIVVLYTILFTCYGVFSVWSFWHTLKDAWEAKRIFEERLGVSPQRLVGGAVDWDKDVVSKLLHLQETGDYRVAIHGQGHLDALVIAQRILRKENFLIAFFNRGNLLDLTVFGLRQTFFCKSLEVRVLVCTRPSCVYSNLSLADTCVCVCAFGN